MSMKLSWILKSEKFEDVPKGHTEAVNRRRTDNTMTKRKRTKEQKTIYKTKHRKQKILTKTGVNSDASEGSTDPAPHVTSVVFLLSTQEV